MVNGPADDALCWDAIDWRFHEDNVRRLRQRIFKAAREQDWPKVRKLDRPGDLGGSDPWKDAESCLHSGSIPMSCVSAR